MRKPHNALRWSADIVVEHRMCNSSGAFQTVGDLDPQSSRSAASLRLTQHAGENISLVIPKQSLITLQALTIRFCESKAHTADLGPALHRSGQYSIIYVFYAT